MREPKRKECSDEGLRWAQGAIEQLFTLLCIATEPQTR